MAQERAQRRAVSGERLAMHALWRLAAWGGAVALALCGVAIATLSQTGSQRLALLLAPAELPVRSVATVKITPPKGSDTERLTARLRELSADRDQLSDRVTNLERQLDEITGSIRRLAAGPASQQVAKTTPQPASPAAAPPIGFPLAMLPNDAATWPTPLSSLGTAQTESDEAGAPAPDATGSVPTSSAEETSQALPPALEKVPLPSAQIASAEPEKTGFGLALAGASSLELTRIQWTMLQANFKKLLTGLEPRALSERRHGAAHYQLVAGPLPTLKDAATLCARLIAAHTTCQPVKFSGDPL
jgi:hypothetical protein